MVRYDTLWYSEVTSLTMPFPDVISCSEPHNPDMETDPHSSDLGGASVILG